MLPLGHINLTDTCESHMRHIQNMLSIGAGLRAMLAGLAMALMSIVYPAAHADAFGSGSKAATGTPSADLESRIKALEALLSSVNEKLSQAQTAGGTSSAAPSATVSPEEFVYEPSYEVGGTVNGYVIVRRNGKMQMLTSREFVVFRSQDKARAYKEFLLEQSGLSLTTAAEDASSSPPANNGNGNGHGYGNQDGTGNGTGNSGNGNGNGTGTGTGNGNGNQGNGNGNGGAMPPPPPPPTPSTTDGRAAALAKKK